MDWLSQNWIWVLVFAAFTGCICSDTEVIAATVVAMARKINAQQTKKNPARIGRKVINIKEIYHD